MIVVGRAESRDAEAVVRLAHRSLAETYDAAWWMERLSKGGCLVARDVWDDHIVGLAVAEKDAPCEGHLCALAVEPEHQGEGIGSTLLRTMQDRLARSGAYRLHLEVREDDAPARAFYTRHGFFPEGLLERAYSDGTAAIRFTRPLS